MFTESHIAYHVRAKDSVYIIDMYRFPRSPIVTSLLYVVPEADARELVAAPIKAKWK